MGKPWAFRENKQNLREMHGGCDGFVTIFPSCETPQTPGERIYDNWF